MTESILELLNSKTPAGYGTTASAKRTVLKNVYWWMVAEGYNVAILNERYLVVDGKDYMLSKSGTRLVWKNF